MEWVGELRKLSLYKKYSQYGEETIIQHIFKNIGTTNRYYVDFGAGDGYSLSNTRFLKEEGWSGLMMDGNNKNNSEVKQEFITAENINSLFKKYNVPESFDFLSIDIDGNDLWVWKNLEYKPRVVIIEFNGTIEHTISKTIRYNPNHIYKHDDYYGASFEALKKVGKEKGYTLVHQCANTNVFFILSDLVQAPEYDVSYNCTQYHKIADYDTEWVKY